jgi:predicted PurR-regulated permease PerM
MTKEQRFWLELIIAICAASFLVLGIYSLKSILVPFLAGFIGAYTLRHLVSRLEQWRLGRGLASALVILSLLFIICGLTLFALPYIQQQLTQLAAAVPNLASRWLETISPLLEKLFDSHPVQIEELQRQLTTHIGSLLQLGLQFFINLISSSAVIANLLSWVVLTPLIMFYLLKDWPKLFNNLQNLIPLKYRNGVISISRDIDHMLSAYAWGQIRVCLILAVLYACGLRLIGLEQGVFLGLLTGLLAFIPYVGALIGFLASLGLMLAQTGDFHLLTPIVLVFFVINFIEANLLTPRLIGQKIGLHPLWILFALLAGGSWFGFVGLVFTLPMAALVGILVRVMIRYYEKSFFYQGQ